MQDFSQHNAEVIEVMNAYRAGRPIRVPMRIGINPRFTMFDHPANPTGITFEQYFTDPANMLQRILEHSEWVRFNVPQDLEMGLPAKGWDVYVDFQNTYSAAWLGAPITFSKNQVPATEPILFDDNKRMLFDRGIPDPVTDGLQRRRFEFLDYFQARKQNGFTWRGRPIGVISTGGEWTDGPVTIACNLRGTEFLSDLIEAPEYAQELMTFIMDAEIARLSAQKKRAGTPLKMDAFGFADDSISLLSTEMYRELVLPHHRRLVETFGTGKDMSIHLCGDATRYFPTIVKELGIQSFDTGFPVDHGALRKTLGPKIEILGGPSVPFLIRATADEVREETKRILSSGVMDGGRFILREGNNLAPGTAIENIRAMYETAKEFGTYPRGN